jgi:hypothetical protein
MKLKLKIEPFNNIKLIRRKKGLPYLWREDLIMSIFNKINDITYLTFKIKYLVFKLLILLILCIL